MRSRRVTEYTFIRRIETISQRTKLERMKPDRYQALLDGTVDQVLAPAKARNLEWWNAESPHIP